MGLLFVLALALALAVCPLAILVLVGSLRLRLIKLLPLVFRILLAFDNFVESLASSLLGVLLIVGNKHIVEHRTGINRPQLEANVVEGFVFGVCVGSVVRVRDHR